MVSWNRTMEMLEDKEQTQLSLYGCKPNESLLAKKKVKAEYWKKYICPFCLEENSFYKFKKIHGFYKCPKCNIEMTLRSLVKTMSVEEFAKWVFEYRLSGFWKKVNAYMNDRDKAFREWNNKLYEHGISFEFWETYKRLKGVSDLGVNEE